MSLTHFRSKAGAEVLMLQAHAEAVLHALGREPAPQGIFLPAQIDAALEAFAAFAAATASETSTPEAGDALEPAAPDLARRAWPLLDLLRHGRRRDTPVTWSSF